MCGGVYLVLEVVLVLCCMQAPLPPALTTAPPHPSPTNPPRSPQPQQYAPTEQVDRDRCPSPRPQSIAARSTHRAASPEEKGRETEVGGGKGWRVWKNFPILPGMVFFVLPLASPGIPSPFPHRKLVNGGGEGLWGESEDCLGGSSGGFLLFFFYFFGFFFAFRGIRFW